MRIARMKKVWDGEDKQLFSHGHFSATGILQYWCSIDNAIEFNEKNGRWKQWQQHPAMAQTTQQSMRGKRRGNDRFHWSNNSRR